MGYERVLAALAGPARSRALGLALLGLVLSLPALATGLYGDDYDLLERVATDPLGAFAFTPADVGLARVLSQERRALGVAPWWQDPSYRQRFLRPLASFSHFVDGQVLHAPAWCMHLENALFYALLVWIAGFAYRAVGLPSPAWALAMLFFACNAGPATSVGWISGRNTILSALFGLLSVGTFARACTQHDARSRFISHVAFAASLLSGENGVATLAWLFAYALTLDTDHWGRRVVRLAPFLLITTLWCSYYVRGGYGAAGSAFHRDLANDPLGFLQQAAVALPIYVASQLTAPFAGLAALFPGSQLWTLGIAVVALVWLWRKLWTSLRANVLARFFLLGSVGSVVPLAATVPQDRLAFFVAFGALGLIAQLLAEVQTGAELRALGLTRLWRMHGLWSVLLFVPFSFVGTSSVLAGGARALDLAAPRSAERQVLLINGPSALSSHFVTTMRRHDAVPCPRFRMLYAGYDPVSVLRADDRSLELHVEAGWLATAVTAFSRDLRRAPFAVGDVIELPDVRIEILAINARGAPERVRFRFAHSLDDQQAQLLVWRDRAYVPWRAPQIGRSELVPGALPF